METLCDKYTESSKTAFSMANFTADFYFFFFQFSSTIVKTFLCQNFSFERMTENFPLISTEFDLTTRDSYSMILVEVLTNHILAKNTYFTNHIELTEHKIIVLKPGNKYQIIWQFHYFKNIVFENFQHPPFPYRAKVF